MSLLQPTTYSLLNNDNTTAPLLYPLLSRVPLLATFDTPHTMAPHIPTCSHSDCSGTDVFLLKRTNKWGECLFCHMVLCESHHTCYRLTLSLSHP